MDLVFKISGNKIFTMAIFMPKRGKIVVMEIVLTIVAIVKEDAFQGCYIKNVFD